MNQPTANSYDQAPYPGYAYPQTHPDRMAVIGRVLGLDPADVATCRVLELGCTDGGNLIPMALSYPQAHFVGVDYSAIQIDMGRAQIADLGLPNIELVQANILDLDQTLGQFDYIIAHGVYSWVPSEVRDAVMAICARHLNPNGIAYISYNTYPGWHLLEPIRSLLRYRVAGIDDPMQRVAIATALIEQFADEQNQYLGDLGMAVPLSARLLQSRLDNDMDTSHSTLLHDLMEEVNQPVYFWQFMQHADYHGLQYLAEANLGMVLPENLPMQAQAEILRMSQSGIDIEQYMDFYRGRTFRQTLLCHAQVPLRRVLRPLRLTDCFVSSLALPVAPPVDLQPTVEMTFRANTDQYTTANPIMKAALVILAHSWPQVITVQALFEQAYEQLQAAQVVLEVPKQQLLEQLAFDLLRAFCQSVYLVRFHSCPPQVATEVSSHPVASALARRQAQTQSIVTTLYHESVVLEPQLLRLLPLVDGTRDRAAIQRDYQALADSGDEAADQATDDMETVSNVDQLVRQLLWRGLLVE